MWVLIPAKDANLAKSRLAPVLTNQARASLARQLLRRLLALLVPFPDVRNVVVMSADPTLRSIAHRFGYHSLPDPTPDPDLNAALEAGRQYALSQGANALLILPTDLPMLSQSALTSLFEQIPPAEPQIMIAYDREGTGTNALFLRPANAIPFSFGLHSGPRHRELALQAGISLLEVSHPALAFDLDWPEDWAYWNSK